MNAACSSGEKVVTEGLQFFTRSSLPHSHARALDAATRVHELCRYRGISDWNWSPPSRRRHDRPGVSSVGARCDLARRGHRCEPRRAGDGRGSDGRGRERWPRLPKARRRPRSRFRCAVRGAALARTAESGHRPGLRFILATDRGRQRRAAGRDLGAGVRREERPHVLVHARPGRHTLPGARGDRLQRRRGNGDIPVPGHEPRRCGLSRLPDRDRGRIWWTATGYVRAETRVARYNGSVWSVLGVPVNRNQSSPVASPTAANSAKVGIDTNGNGIVAFQEPDDEFVDRIWARRLFGSTLGVPLIVSPQQFGGLPLRGAADALALDVTTFGRAAVAFRQQPGERSSLTRTRVLVNMIPEAFSPDARQVRCSPDSRRATRRRVARHRRRPAASAPPRTASCLSASAPARRRWPPTATTPRSTLPRDSTTVAPEWRVARSSSLRTAKERCSPGGRAQQPWPSRSTTATARTRSGTHTPRPAGRSGDLTMAGSGLGDSLVAFRQGEAQPHITAVTVDSPPLDFAVNTPDPLGAVEARAAHLGPGTERARLRSVQPDRRWRGACAQPHPPLDAAAHGEARSGQARGQRDRHRPSRPGAARAASRTSTSTPRAAGARAAPRRLAGSGARARRGRRPRASGLRRSTIEGQLR